MLSIKNNVINEISIKKSRFITFLYRVDSISDIENYLDGLKCDYSDSTHICYAYILDNIKRFSDNGEPGGTAGMPILGVLESNNLNHVLCVVIRYYGGIKLGANGLVRAYSSSCSSAILCTNIVNLVLGKICRIDFSYDNTKVIDNLLKNCLITERSYDSLISYIFNIDSENLSFISSEIRKHGHLSIIGDCFIEKETSK